MNGEMMPKVYITQRAVFKDREGTRFAANYTKAERFGELVLLIDSRPLIPEECTPDLLEEKLADFTEDDYLLLSGDPLACALCAVAASRMTRGRVRFLRYDSKVHDYTEHVVDWTHD
jgi:hypothetical protein